MSERTTSVCTFKKATMSSTLGTQNIVGLSDGPADPRCGSPERKGALLELLVKSLVLIVYAVIDDDRGDRQWRTLAASMRMMLN